MPTPAEDIAFLDDQLTQLLTLVETSGIRLRDHGSIIEEHGGDLDNLREIVKGHAQIGDAMVRAVKRTRETVWPE